jgi:hypothetical protein
MKGPVVSFIVLCRYSINIAALVVFLLGSVHGYAQSNIRYKTVAVHTDTLKLDSLSVVPGTLAIKHADGLLIDTNDYTLYAFQSLADLEKEARPRFG